jgi:hypothetical protein
MAINTIFENGLEGAAVYLSYLIVSEVREDPHGLWHKFILDEVSLKCI